MWKVSASGLNESKSGGAAGRYKAWSIAHSAIRKVQVSGYSAERSQEVTDRAGGYWAARQMRTTPGHIYLRVIGLGCLGDVNPAAPPSIVLSTWQREAPKPHLIAYTRHPDELSDHRAQTQREHMLRRCTHAVAKATASP